MVFMNLPNQVPAPNENNLTSEADKYYSLYTSLNRTDTGVSDYSSASSGKKYSTNDYPSDKDVFNKGQVGMMNLLYKYVLKPYIVVAEVINSAIERSENSIIDAAIEYNEASTYYVVTLAYEAKASTYTIRFKSPNGYVAGARFKIGNDMYNPVLSGSEDVMPAGTFMNGRIITANVDRTGKTITFNSSASSPIIKSPSAPTAEGDKGKLWVNTTEETMAYNQDEVWIKVKGVWA